MTRERGTYGPLDRDRHFVIGWGADEAVGFTRDRTIGAAIRPVLPTLSDAWRAQRGASQWWRATRGIGGRDAAARPATEIGQELFHTAADRDRAIASLSTGFRSLASDLALWMTSNTTHPEASATAQWLASDVTPTLEEWQQFVANEQRSWWSKIATSWETFEGWWERLKQLRSFARARGIVLQSVDPAPLPKTIWQRSEEGKGSEMTAVLGVLKIGVLSVVAIMGAVGVYSALKSVHARSEATASREELVEALHEELDHERKHKKA